MRLTRATICGYRSFRSETTVELDNRITVLLGANDHGKTNFLAALRHLNVDQGFDGEVDLNWDEESGQDEFPRIRYFLKPEGTEQEELRTGIHRQRRLSFISEQLEKVEEETRLIADDISNLQNVIDNKSEDESPDLSGQGGNSASDGGTVEERLAARKSELVAKGSIRERWLSLYELVSQIENGDIANASSNVLLQQLKRRVSSLQSELSKAAASKADREQTLATAKEGDDKSRIAAAENDLGSAQAKYARAQSTFSAASESVRLLELHIKFFGDTADKEYSKMVQAVSKIPAKCPGMFVLERKGVEGDLLYLDDDEMIPIPDYLRKFLPKVEIFSSVDQLPDGVSQDTIWNAENRFMRGIFYYAGLKSSDWKKVFSLGDQTSKKLADASGKLNEILQRDWRQGKELTFKLEHRGDGRIDLIIQDPKVQSRYVRISRRSSGFTHFFGLKTILHSSEVESSAASHIWLFDEPGISLHPDGQHDLLQALDTISRQNQVVYTTHSLFMIDKNYPARHRLIAKADNGTKVDGKPYLGNWRAAIDALGLALPGTILFAKHVLLVEGPSDAIILNALLQVMAEEGMHNLDINPLSVMPTGDAKEAVALARILRDANVQPRIVALYDGDDGGKKRKAKLESVLDGDAHVFLPTNKTIEDYILGFDEVFVPTAAAYSSRVFGTSQEAAQAAIIEALKGAGQDEKRVDVVLGAIATAAKLDGAPSKVGIARDYTHALLEKEIKFSKAEMTALKKLLDQLQAALRLPSRTTIQEKILQEE